MRRSIDGGDWDGEGWRELAEKRRALGRGLEFCCRGHGWRRRLRPSAEYAEGWAPASSSLSSSSFSSPAAGFSSDAEGGRAGTPVAPPEALAETLDELHAVASGRTADGETVFLLALDQIDPNPYQTRREFDQELLAELADSIRVQGVSQPVVVRPGKEGRFVLVLGERRLRASRLAEKPTIPVIVRRVSEQQAAEMTLVENLQRKDLNCVEQAEAFANVSTQFKLTQEEIGGGRACRGSRYLITCGC